MVRQHGSLTKDDETNQAAWEAAKGAAIGGTKVSYSFFLLLLSWVGILWVSACYGAWSGKAWVQKRWMEWSVPRGIVYTGSCLFAAWHVWV